jgi:competence protein ComEC
VVFRPVVPLALALISGIIIGESLPGFAWVTAVVFLTVAVKLVICLRQDRPVPWLPLLMTMAAGYLSMVPWVSPSFGPDHVVQYLNTGSWQIQGTVADQPVFRYGRSRMILDIDGLARKDESFDVRGRIRLTVMGDASLNPGDRVNFSAKIRPFRNFNNPGGFDYRRYMAFKGIHGSAWVKAENIQRVGSHAQFFANQLIQRIRRRLAHLIHGAGNDNYSNEKAVLKALVFGDRSGIDHELRERFNRVGAGHLLAISGLHVGIVATVAFGFFHWTFSFIPSLLWRGWGRQWAAAAALIPVLAYGSIAGMSPSTQRAVIMVGIFMAAMIVGRAHDIFNTLAAAALVILALYPPALFSISFQLSFAAVLAIVYGLDRLAIDMRPNQAWYRRAGWRLMIFTLVSALAVAGTTPVALYHFNQASAVGLAANLFLVPLVGFMVVPVGLLSALVALFSESLATMGFWLSIELLRLAMTVVTLFAGVSFAALKTVTPSLFEILLYYLIGWSVLNFRKAVVAPWVLAAGLMLFAGDMLYWSYQRFWHEDLRVTAIDVGQGTATLMEMPGGEVVLTDGGGYANNRLFDMGRLVVAPVLWRRKIATVDILILSHPNADHLNGLIYIARYFNVRELWANGDANTTRGYEEMMTTCREKGIVVRKMAAGAGRTDDGPVTIEVLHPPADFFDHPGAVDQEARNNGSLVVKATYGETAFLMTGDIMVQAERELVQRVGDDLTSTVLFAPHHGSRTSSSPELIAAVAPEIVVISAGVGNRFGFPHDEVVDRFRLAGVRVLCTATHGAVEVRSDGEVLLINAFED